MIPISAYPLTWPFGQPRTPSHRRRSADFKLDFVQARDALVRELRLLGAKGIVISTSVPTRADGLPGAPTREPDDCGVAVYFERRRDVRGAPGDWSPFVIACDTYSKVRWNLRAVGTTIEALRTIQRHGASSMLEQAFSGFAALPPASVGRPWWEVLGVPRGASEVDVRDAFRELARVHHPDVGGSLDRMSEINVAFAEAKAKRFQ